MNQWRSILNISYSEENDALRNIRVRTLNTFLVSGSILGALLIIVSIMQNLKTGGWGLFPIYVATYLWIVAATIWRNAPYILRALSLPIVLFLLGVSVTLESGMSYSVGPFLLGFILISTIFLDARGGILALAACILLIAVMGILVTSGLFVLPFAPIREDQLNPLYWTISGLVTALIGIIISVTPTLLTSELNSNLRKLERVTDELTTDRNQLSATKTQLERSLARSRAVAEISGLITTITDPNVLLDKAIETIQSQLGLYYAAILLASTNGRFLELKAASGEAGRLLKENHYKVDVENRNSLTAAFQSRQPQVEISGEEKSSQLKNPLLPYTKSQAVLPLIVSGQALGVLDLQSSQQNTFFDEDIETLQGMANQVAIAMENARLFQEAEQSLQEMRAIQQQYLSASWKTYSEENSLGYTIGELDPEDKLGEMGIPLTLRDQTIGEIKLAGKEDWSSEEKGLIEAIAAQAALALENARLVEESQSTAKRERLVSEVTSKIWSSNTVDGILQTAVRELGRALEASEVNIEINLEGQPHD
ncbi:MAG: GAF domain-containing protein [Chloroflexi bacterium]|nr:GAF domain-containing protein [Chloroflexota bacterium]